MGPMRAGRIGSRRKHDGPNTGTIGSRRKHDGPNAGTIGSRRKHDGPNAGTIGSRRKHDGPNAWWVVRRGEMHLGAIRYVSDLETQLLSSSSSGGREDLEPRGGCRGALYALRHNTQQRQRRHKETGGHWHSPTEEVPGSSACALNTGST
jgi:hypothetical protein